MEGDRNAEPRLRIDADRQSRRRCSNDHLRNHRIAINGIDNVVAYTLPIWPEVPPCLSVLPFGLWRMETRRATSADRFDGLPPRGCTPLVCLFGQLRRPLLRTPSRYSLRRWRTICLPAVLWLALCKPTADAAASRLGADAKDQDEPGRECRLACAVSAKAKGNAPAHI